MEVTIVIEKKYKELFASSNIETVGMSFIDSLLPNLSFVTLSGTWTQIQKHQRTLALRVQSFGKTGPRSENIKFRIQNWTVFQKERIKLERIWKMDCHRSSLEDTMIEIVPWRKEDQSNRMHFGRCFFFLFQGLQKGIMK